MTLAVFWGFLTLASLLLTVAGWTLTGARLALVSSSEATEGRSLVSRILGNSKLVWLWALLLAVSTRYLLHAVALGERSSRIVLFAVVALAFFCCVVSAVVTKTRRAGRKAIAWSKLLLRLAVMLAAMLVATLLLAAWLSVGR